MTAPAVSRWQFHDQYGWHDYDASASDALELVRGGGGGGGGGVTTLHMGPQHTAYRVDVTTRVQTNVQTGYQRRIRPPLQHQRRLAAAAASAAASATTRTQESDIIRLVSADDARRTLVDETCCLCLDGFTLDDVDDGGGGGGGGVCPSSSDSESASASPAPAPAPASALTDEQRAVHPMRPVRLSRCPAMHAFHFQCDDNMSIHDYILAKRKCPLCMTWYGELSGNMPSDGTMRETEQSHVLAGSDATGATGSVCVDFRFPDGVQGDEHANPGVAYAGDHRQAFLPNCADGRRVLRMFRAAWARRLLFTIGRSETRGRDNLIVYNGIHMKTGQTGGTPQYGYPDPSYLSRVTAELEDKGVFASEFERDE
jgi:deltex-like protein